MTGEVGGTQRGVSDPGGLGERLAALAAARREPGEQSAGQLLVSGQEELARRVGELLVSGEVLQQLVGRAQEDVALSQDQLGRLTIALTEMNDGIVGLASLVATEVEGVNGQLAQLRGQLAEHEESRVRDRKEDRDQFRQDLDDALVIAVQALLGPSEPGQ